MGTEGHIEIERYRETQTQRNKERHKLIHSHTGTERCRETQT